MSADVVLGELSLGGQHVRAGRPVPAGVAFTAESALAALRVSPAVELRLQRGTRARIVTARADHTEVELSAGALLASVDPTARPRFVVQAAGCRGVPAPVTAGEARGQGQGRTAGHAPPAPPAGAIVIAGPGTANGGLD